MTIISGKEAWGNISKFPHTRWSENISRFADMFAKVEHEPKFLLTYDDRFFCIGSCFARNIEEHLIYSGITVLSKKIVNSIEGWQFRINGIINKFTTESMLNEVEWLIKKPNFDEIFFEETSGSWRDLQLVAGIRPSEFSEVKERRIYLSSDYFNRLRSATVVVVTLGLNEVWFDTVLGCYLNAAPSYFSVRRDPARYFLKITNVDENISALERIREILLTFNPAIKMIVTVSPVPLSESFQQRDVLVSNMMSKSTLRVAADIFARNHDNVDYFPTFDMISMAPRNLAFIDDCIHVRDKVVGSLMRVFLDLYLQQKTEPVEFNESAYLAANPDVDSAVRGGYFESGFQHWQNHGVTEGRPLRPKA